MADKFTRQGVRNLDTRPRNGKRPTSEHCVHRWEHDPECPCKSAAFGDFGGACYQFCPRCGAVRGVER
jgi:hypothetical protein